MFINIISKTFNLKQLLFDNKPQGNLHEQINHVHRNDYFLHINSKEAERECARNDIQTTTAYCANNPVIDVDGTIYDLITLLDIIHTIGNTKVGKTI